jgi:integrase
VVLNAQVFLFHEVLKQPDLAFGDVARERRPRRPPTVLESSEVAAVLGCLEGTQRLMIGLMNGTGMRLMECCRLRV